MSRSYTITNTGSAFTGRAVGTTLGSARRARPTITDGQQQEYSFFAAPGSTSVEATIGNASDSGADLDLLLYDCTSGTCRLAGTSGGLDSEEHVESPNPQPGLWTVAVDGFSVPTGGVAYDYVDVFTNPAFGTVSITDANALRPSGAQWTVPATVTAMSPPAAGRVLLGHVQVRTNANVLAGQNDVIVQNVS